MSQIFQDNYFIITGAMGAGKSTLLKEFLKRGLLFIDEPARQILAEQRAIEREGIPDHNPKLFTELLLSRSIAQLNQMKNNKSFVLYDRGIQDNLCYAKLFDLDLKPYMLASHQYQ